MKSKILLLRCPRCKQEMKYQGMTFILGNKRKTCVYCGHRFIIKDNITRTIES